FAHCAGRHRADGPGPGPLRQLGEALHGGGGAGHGGGGEPARAEHLFSPPHGGPIFRQHLGPARRRHFRDLQADRVRAEVYDREDLPVTLGRRHSPGSITKSWMEGTSGWTSTGRREWSVSRWTTTASGKLLLYAFTCVGSLSKAQATARSSRRRAWQISFQPSSSSASAGLSQSWTRAPSGRGK